MNHSSFPEETFGVTDWKELVGRSIRASGCALFLCGRGSASVAVNMQSGRFAKGDMAIITSDVYFHVAEISADFSAKFLSFPEAFIETAYHQINSTVLWDYLHNMPVLSLSASQYRLVAGWFDQANWILYNITGENRATMFNNATYNLFSAIDFEIGKAIERSELVARDWVWELTARFWTLIIRHFRNERSVKFYASSLNITPDYLTKVCRKAYGMSPKSMIEQQVLVEIKSLLSDTSMSVTQIAIELNFEDSSYLCRFFRRHTGYSPITFRNSMKNM